MIRKAHKTALGLLDCTSTEKLLALSVHNTLEKVGEAQRAAQIERLKETKTGRAILARLDLDPGTCEEVLCGQEEIPENIRSGMWAYPIRKNMDPEHGGERRKARAKAMVEVHT